MTIHTQDAPKSGRRILHAALGRRLHRAAHMPSLRGEPKSGHPLPLYRLTEHGLAQDVPLAHARRIGWQYPVIGGDLPGLASLRRTAGGLRYASLIEGPLAQRLLDAALLAEQNLAKHEAEFQPRRLQIPSLQAELLWMYRPRGGSLFVSLSEARQAPELALETLRPIVTRASKRLKASRKR